ncbi:MAG: helix-turn-helix domain-containing protein [Actinomycetia bacterium]|nr:helix-turn-helix domain-containing protein [Actinomycetes bacterium]
MSGRRTQDPYFEQTVELFARRWCGPVLEELNKAPCGFSQLQQSLPELPAQLLRRRLDELETSGLVQLATDPACEAEATYALTDAGQNLCGLIAHIDVWAQQWLRPASGGD